MTETNPQQDLSQILGLEGMQIDPKILQRGLELTLVILETEDQAQAIPLIQQLQELCQNYELPINNFVQVANRILEIQEQQEQMPQMQPQQDESTQQAWGDINPAWLQEDNNVEYDNYNGYKLDRESQELIDRITTAGFMTGSNHLVNDAIQQSDIMNGMQIRKTHHIREAFNEDIDPEMAALLGKVNPILDSQGPDRYKSYQDALNAYKTQFETSPESELHSDIDHNPILEDIFSNQQNQPDQQNGQRIVDQNENQLILQKNDGGLEIFERVDDDSDFDMQVEGISYKFSREIAPQDVAQMATANYHTSMTRMSQLLDKRGQHDLADRMDALAATIKID
jgi:hypothetical protein